MIVEKLGTSEFCYSDISGFNDNTRTKYTYRVISPSLRQNPTLRKLVLVEFPRMQVQ